MSDSTKAPARLARLSFSQPHSLPTTLFSWSVVTLLTPGRPVMTCHRCGSIRPLRVLGWPIPPPLPSRGPATGDIGSAQILSFVLFNRNANEPAGIIADEIRVGPSWASVTPPAESPEVPSLSISRSGNNSALSWSTNSPGFVLELLVRPVFMDAGRRSGVCERRPIHRDQRNRKYANVLSSALGAIDG